MISNTAGNVKNLNIKSPSFKMEGRENTTRHSSWKEFKSTLCIFNPINTRESLYKEIETVHKNSTIPGSLWLTDI